MRSASVVHASASLVLLMLVILQQQHAASGFSPSAPPAFLVADRLSSSFSSASASFQRRRRAAATLSASSSSTTAAETTGAVEAKGDAVDDLQKRIEECIRDGDDPERYLLQLEKLNPTPREPNRSPKFFGEWHVWYTNCPPPSNGQLGPFQGTASQVIDAGGAAAAADSVSRSYQNLLRVPPNDWLTATLDGVWEEWDGSLLDTGKPSTVSVDDGDWGAEHWKVTFLQLQIGLLGFPIFTKTFDADTSRIWRTTYLDDEIRIVRAGKTGRLEDEVVFYTRRTPPPLP